MPDPILGLPPAQDKGHVPDGDPRGAPEVRRLAPIGGWTRFIFLRAGPEGKISCCGVGLGPGEIPFEIVLVDKDLVVAAVRASLHQGMQQQGRRLRASK